MTPQAQESSTNPFVWQLHKDLLYDDYQFDVSHGLFMDSILHTQYNHYKWSIYFHVRSTLHSPCPCLMSFFLYSEIDTPSTPSMRRLHTSRDNMASPSVVPTLVF
jgi:hypothetical protein